MKPIYWTFHANRWLEEAGHLRYRRRSLQPLKGGRCTASRRSTSGSRARRAATRARSTCVPAAAAPAADRAFADIDFGSHPRLLLRDRRPDLPRRGERGARATRATRSGSPTSSRRSAHPETGEPAFDVLRKEELYHGPFLDQGAGARHPPARRADPRRLVATRRGRPPFERHDTLDPERFYGYSGHHGLTGILAAAGPGIRPGPTCPEGSEITQLPATLLRLLGLAAPRASTARRSRRSSPDATAGARPRRPPTRTPEAAEEPVYSEEEEAAWSSGSATSATSRRAVRDAPHARKPR